METIETQNKVKYELIELFDAGTDIISGHLVKLTRSAGNILQSVETLDEAIALAYDLEPYIHKMDPF